MRLMTEDISRSNNSTNKNCAYLVKYFFETNCVFVIRMLFDYLLKRYRQSISYRERSKDMLVQITHKLRLGYRKLGEKLVENGSIPDSKLIFFLSQYEMRNICDHNCPEIVHK